jgi:hypothetical protein
MQAGRVKKNGLKPKINASDPVHQKQALKIVDALHTGSGHAPPGSVERACQINCPATGLDEHGCKAEPTRVHGRVIDAKISSEPD